MSVGPTIATLRKLLATGLPPAELVRRAYARMREVEDPGIMITTVPEPQAIAAAEALGAYDPNRPLWGIPFAVKDNIDVAGLPTTAACPAYAYTPEHSAFAVQRLLNAGAICIGKTNLDQFATGLVGVRTPHPVPRNAADPELVPGGSSSALWHCWRGSRPDGPRRPAAAWTRSRSSPRTSPMPGKCWA
jgi:allophanate hydrolase